MTDYTVDRSRWSQMNIFEQMGNIYSEVGRSLNAKKAGRINDSQAATYRALDLLDATVDNLVKQRSPRVKEVLRAREQYLHAILDTPQNQQDIDYIDKYFQQFAIAQRLTR